MTSPTVASYSADQLLDDHRQQVYRQTDHWFAILLVVQWIASIGAAVWISPRTWDGRHSQIHLHVWAAIFLGGAITSLPVGLALLRPGKALTRHVIATSQMLMSALLIHLTGGRIETHFHVFGSLAFLAFYRDWKVLIPATAVVALDHMVRGLYFPESVFGVLVASPWRWVEHAGWVLFENVILIKSCVRGTQEMREIAERQSELSLSKEAFREQTEIWKSVLDSIGEGVVVADVNGNILRSNPAAEKMLGLDAKNTRPGERRYRFFWTDMVSECPTAELPLARAIRGEAVDGANLYFRPQDSDPGVWISVTARPVHAGDGKLRGGVAVFRDITQIKQTEEILKSAKEEAEQANRAKSEFLSRMSHELRTPLNAILGFGQLLEMEQLNARGSESVKQILKGGAHLLHLIDEVLDIARVEAGRISLSAEPVLINALLEETLDLIRPLAGQRGIEIRNGLSLAEWYAFADYQRLKQVLLNVLSNAIKYNRDRGTVQISCQEITPGWLRLEVTDTGSGLSSKDLEKLFTPFERLGAERVGIQGTGLGLMLSKRLMEAMGGRIGVTSVVGDGSTFWLELPVAEPSMKRLQQQLEQGVVPFVNQSGHSQTVLYIEDNVSNLTLVEHILTYRPRVRLVAAMQGQLGMELAREHQPDLILLDVHLPDIRGDEVLRRLREDPCTAQIPVIVVSADATPGQIKRLLAAGARAYLTKPLDIKQLLGALDDVLNREEVVSHVG